MTGQIGFRPTTWVDGTRLDIPQPEGLRYPSQEELLQRLKNDILRNPPLPPSRWRRAAAGLIDMALLGLVWRGLVAFLATGGSAAGLPAASVDVGAFLLTTVLGAIYAMGCWTLWCATLGMALLRVCVGDERFGAPMSTRQAWQRFVVWYLLGIPAFLAMLVSRDPWGRTWYDRASRTVVLAD